MVQVSLNWDKKVWARNITIKISLFKQSPGETDAKIVITWPAVYFNFGAYQKSNHIYHESNKYFTLRAKIFFYS